MSSVRCYRIGHDYRDLGSIRAEDDQFLSWINLPGSGMRNMGGIRPLKFTTIHQAVTAAIVLVTDQRTAGSTANPWDDIVGIPHARIVYWGDAKFDPRRTVNDFPGNRALRDAFHQVQANQAALIPPILHFSKRETGVLRFSGLCMLDRLDLTWFEDHARAVRNYRADLKVLDADVVEVDWLHSRMTASSTRDLVGKGPQAWRRYQEGVIQRSEPQRSPPDELPPDAMTGEPTVEWIIDHGMDIPLGRLYPQLLLCEEQEITSTSMPVRMRNVLSRWRGLVWGSYLEVTPREFLARRNAGLGSLRAVLGVAAATRPEATAGGREARPTGMTGVFEDIGRPDSESSDATHVVELLMPIVAWGAFERGRLDLSDILNTAQVDEDAPTEVTEALARLSSVDWRALTGPLAAHFDPWVPLRDLVAGLDDFDRAILRERLVTLQRPATLDELGRRREISRERVRQIESRLARRLRSLSTDRRHSLGRTIERVRSGIGLAMQVGHAQASDVLAELHVDSLEDLDTMLLLWLAGPYQIAGEWLVRQPFQVAVEETRTSLRTLTSDGPAELVDAEAALEARGVIRAEAREWMVSVGGFRIHEEQVGRWGGSIADRAEVVLRLSGSPLTRDELASRIGSNTNVRSMANQLYDDPRFKRTGIRQFGLAEWDHDEYTGVADEIAQEIGRQGGEAKLDHLVSFVSATYGVSESSVRAYASGPRFERSPSGAVRLRTETSVRSESRPIEMTRGAFVVDGLWGLRIRVNDQHLRGSGFPIPQAVAKAFGIEPLSAIELDSAWGVIRMGWPSLSPHIGSVRPALEALGATEGDLVFLVADDGALSMRLVRRSTLEAASGLERLVAEVSALASDGDPRMAVARALALDESSSEATIARRLRARGEDELASLATEQDDDGPLMLSLSASRFVEFKMSR